ncbi:hypothetical protein B5807_11688 [Epicoccum nigrum]|uniref:Uncharacterized protein n=1 Tax=Epicoccum nigrum TaxID=105696 RepID=A0A1Y2LIC0_EPING|nr:hypothetical protein B5807_11688 [Epicoccum nigrum]
MDNTTALSLQKKALKILLLFILGSFALALLIIVFTLIILIIYCIETVMASVLSAFVPLLTGKIFFFVAISACAVQLLILAFATLILILSVIVNVFNFIVEPNRLRAA